MKRILSMTLVVLALLTSCSGDKKGSATRKLTPDDTIAMQFGKIYGTLLKSCTQQESFTRDFLVKGLKNRYNAVIDTALFSQSCDEALKADSATTTEQTLQLISQAVSYLETAHFTGLEKRPQIAENRKAGEEFIAKQLKADTALKLTPSGLIYKVVKPSNGSERSRTDAIFVSYKATHIDGSTLDDSHGQMRTIQLRTVIPGFAEALSMMGPGEKLHIIIPAYLAYGVQGQGNIKPNETLIYDIEAAEVQ